MMTDRPALRALWNMRLPSLLLLGPALGVLLVDMIFGLPFELRMAAGMMMVVSILLFGVLFNAERRQISRRH
jgi:hypothetical protein